MASSARIFKQDNPYNVVMGRIGDLAMLSMAWFVCCLPVFTIGASTSAAYEVAREIVEDTDEGVFRTFWRAFKRRFGVSCLATLTFAALFALAGFDLWWISRGSGNGASLFYGVMLGVFAVVAMALAFVLPLSGRSKLSFWQQIRQSARLALMRPLVALAIVVLWALPVVLMAVVPGTLVVVPLVWVIVGFGVTFWAQMRMVVKAFALKPKGAAEA
ncbi:MAG: DUF624 domain-containing protein [Bifidobacterium sp.]|nr:DUF624 domain-containing protein [Bifidobacterium sp.]